MRPTEGTIAHNTAMARRPHPSGKLDSYLRVLGLENRADAIRRLVAEDKADEWKRDSEAAMTARALLNGR